MVGAPEIDGVLVVDKPAGLTSHDVVVRVRRALHTKTGHLGTLDPGATGVLPLVLGRATRLARFMQLAEKEYLATVRLGRTTDTYDGDGRTLEERPVPKVSLDQINELLRQFEGEVSQLPPMFSAVKVNGERLYKSARRGETRERPKRRVSIYRIDLLTCYPEAWDLKIHCSAGTYIRALAHDIGKELHCGAYLERLRRTRSGPFSLSIAVTLETLFDNWQNFLLPMEDLLPDFPAVVITSDCGERVVNGNPVEYRKTIRGEYCRLIHQEHLLAIGKVKGSLIYPKVVLQSRL